MSRKATATRFHSMTLVLEKDGIQSKTGVFNSSLLANLLDRYNEKGMRPIQAEHSKYCLCGKGKGEKVEIA
jgi:hypothetical protein